MSETGEYDLNLYTHTRGHGTCAGIDDSPGKWGGTWRYGRGHRGVAPNIGSTNAGACHLLVLGYMHREAL